MRQERCGKKHLSFKRKGIKMKKVYNIIDSVKGGCGKTTFSLMLSLLMDDRCKEKQNNNESNVCLIDMDIQGSALVYLLFGGNYFQDEKAWKAFRFLNDRIVAVGDSEKDTREYIHRFQFQDKEKDRKAPGIDVVFSDPRPEIKKRYRSLSNQNYSPEVLYSTYRMGLANMLSKLDGEKTYLHEYVNFDMPPNSDAYSDSVYDVLLKKEYTIMEKDDVCNLFLLQTVDQGQIQATSDYFSELASSENFQKINKIFFVFNDWMDYENGEGLFNEAVSSVKAHIKNCQIPEEIWNNIYFVGLNFDKDYYRLCTQNDGIQNQFMPENMLCLIKYITNIEGEKIKIQTNARADMEETKSEEVKAETDSQAVREEITCEEMPSETNVQADSVQSEANSQAKTEEEKKKEEEEKERQRRMRLADQLIYLLKAGESQGNEEEKNE